jgi:hypothetical protein
MKTKKIKYEVRKLKIDGYNNVDCRHGVPAGYNMRGQFLPAHRSKVAL